MSSLYSKYRPQTFEGVIGQDSIVSVLSKDIADDSTSHAYLFSGPRGTGKTSTARIFALSINCQNPQAGKWGQEPCLKCESCIEIQEGTSLDLIEMDAASNSGVDAVRELIGRVSYSSPGKKKIYLIDEAHMLSPAASNAFLLTLESPPSHVVFILATTDPKKILPTVASRCEKSNFSLVPASTMSSYVGGIAMKEGIDTDLVDIAVNRGLGSVRDTLSALDSIKNLNPQDTALRLESPGVLLLEALGSKDLVKIFSVVAQQNGLGVDMRTLAEDTVSMLRECFLIQMNAGQLVSTLDWGNRDKLANHLGPKSTVAAIERLGEAITAMAAGYDARVNLEIALSRWAAMEKK